MLENPEFVNALPGHLAGDEISQARVPMVLRTLNSLRGLGSMRSAPRQKANERSEESEKPDALIALIQNSSARAASPTAAQL